MKEYIIQDYQKGFEVEQARIGREVAQSWIWPYAYDLGDLLKLHAQPDFDPETRHYCFVEGQMVGYMFSVSMPAGEQGVTTANLDFPRMLPGHEHAAEFLMERALATLKKKGISRVVGRVTSMCPGDIRLAEQMGFTITGWGYKVYYDYEMGWGKIEIADEMVHEIDPEKELDECAEIASKWYKRPPTWCRTLLKEWHAHGLITHLCVREQGRMIAACMAAPNTIRPSTAAIYYIYAPGEESLKPMLARVVSQCIDYGVSNLIVDLINEHRQYEPVYKELGFQKVAEWARCEKILD